MPKCISNGVMFYRPLNSPFENPPVYSQHTTLCYLTAFKACIEEMFM